MLSTYLKHLKLLALAGLLLGANTALAKLDDFKFSSYITEITQDDADLGSIKVSLHGASLKLLINGDTEIRSSGEEIGISELSIDDYVKVDVFIAAEGLVAEEIIVLDERSDQFRLRGRLTGVMEMDGAWWLELLGLDVRVAADANITDRGTGSGNAVDPATLAVDDEVNVRGTFANGELLATNITVGTREQGFIELEGTVSNLAEGSFTLVLDSGVKLAIVTDPDTEISGTLAEGVDVEVEGRFNENLSILAFEVVVDDDGDGDADDDNRRHGHTRDKFDDDSGNDDPGNDEPGIEISQEIRLAGDSTLSGKAEFKLEHVATEVEQEVEIEIEDAPVDTEYAIVVIFGDTEVDFGTFTTNEFGAAEAEFDTDPDDPGEQDLAPLLPAGSDVTGITAVQVLLNGEVVLEGSF